jgi:glycosyltransferase involved in cell wall biosynthesis
MGSGGTPDSYKTNKMMLSVVSPVYKAERILNELVTQIDSELKTITDSYEIILVEDGGPDQSWQVIEKICSENSKVKGIKLSRNFGQHCAISAGLRYSSGEWVIVMDCDLQDRPDQIIKFFNKGKEGYDIVLGSRTNRNDSWLKTKTSWLFYKVLSYLSGIPQDHSIANFGIYNRKVVDAVNELPERMRFFPTLLSVVGFKKTVIDVEHSARPEGKSSYTWSKLMDLSLDVVLANSNKPLKLIVKFGLLTSLLSIVYSIVILIMYLKGEIKVLGYTSLIVSLWFLFSILMIVLGVIGLYVGKVYEGVKNRPSFIVDKILNAYSEKK